MTVNRPEEWDLDRVNRTTVDFRERFGYRDDQLDVAQYREFLGDWGLLDLTGMETRPVEQDGVRGMWVWQAGTQPNQRMVYLHGGGYVGGGWLSHGSLAEGFARAGDCAVFFCDYRLAPEHAFPDPLEDAMAAYHYVRSTGPDGAKDAAHTVFVAGDSAGGGMALALAMRCRDEGLPGPEAVLSMGAFLDLDPASSELIGASGCVADMATAYAADTDRRHPLVSPLFGELSGLPPIVLQIGSKDYLLQDTLRIAERMQAEGVPHALRVWPEMPHVWQKFAKYFAPAREAIAEAMDLLQVAAAASGETFPEQPGDRS